MTSSPTDVTRLLNAFSEGDSKALTDLVPLIYEELRDLARQHMGKERVGHTLQPTALVHEAFLRLVGNDAAPWENRAHFFGAAARAMRRILVERARQHLAIKRGGGSDRVTLVDIAVATDEPLIDLLALDEALDELSSTDHRLAEIVSLRYFAGLTIKETAEVLHVAPATVKRDWTYARAWLFERMTG